MILVEVIELVVHEDGSFHIFGDSKSHEALGRREGSTHDRQRWGCALCVIPQEMILNLGGVNDEHNAKHQENDS